MVEVKVGVVVAEKRAWDPPLDPQDRDCKVRDRLCCTLLMPVVLQVVFPKDVVFVLDACPP